MLLLAGWIIFRDGLPTTTGHIQFSGARGGRALNLFNFRGMLPPLILFGDNTNILRKARA